MRYSREIIEKVKKEICEMAAGLRRKNEIAPVSGRRMTISMSDREIGVVFYPAKEENAPLILGFHGGGFLLGGSALNDEMWLETGKTLDAAVASVDYRQSPDYQYMEAILDAYDAAVYFKKNASLYGIDPEKISVMGCSAGAGLAASVCLYAKEKEQQLFDCQILLYPFLDADTDPLAKGEGSLQGPVMYVFNELHCKPQDAAKPLVSPVFASNAMLRGLPRAIFCYADYDNLKAEGKRYAAMLRRVGISVEEMTAEGMPHGFYEHGFGIYTEAEMGFMSEQERQMVRDGSLHRASVACLHFIKQYFR